MAIALVVSTKVTPAGDSGGTSPAVDTTGANLIVVGVASGSGTTPTVTDSNSNTYTGLSTYTGTYNFSRLFYCLNPTVGSGHTFTLGGGALNQTCSIAAYSGVKTSGAFDQQNGVFQNTSGTTVQTGSITPTANGSLVITTLGVAGAAGATDSINSSLTVEQQLTFSSGNYYGNGLADYIQPTAGAINPTWTVSSAPLGLTGAIASFLPAPTASTITGTGVMGFTGISFAGSGGVTHVKGAGNLAFSGISFVGSGAVIHVKGTGTLAFAGISITGVGFNAGQPGTGLRQFWTC